MKISLVLATKTRVEEFDKCMRSLARQAYADVELIVVDQNEDDRLKNFLTALPFPVVHLRWSQSGAARARSVGLAAATGEIIGFPDDDCWYPDDLLARVAEFFARNPAADGLTGRSEDGEGNPSGGSFSMQPGPVTMGNVWKTGIAYTIFLRAPVCAAVGTFDEELGVGAGTRYGSGEETDYLIRALKAGFRIEYLPALVVYHLNPPLAYGHRHREKAFRYGVGMGRVISKHGYALPFRVRVIFRPLAGAVLSLFTLRFSKAAYHLSIGMGRLAGLWS